MTHHMTHHTTDEDPILNAVTIALSDCDHTRLPLSLIARIATDAARQAIQNERRYQMASTIRRATDPYRQAQALRIKTEHERKDEGDITQGLRAHIPRGGPNL